MPIVPLGACRIYRFVRGPLDFNSSRLKAQALLVPVKLFICSLFETLTLVDIFFVQRYQQKYNFLNMKVAGQAHTIVFTKPNEWRNGWYQRYTISPILSNFSIQGKVCSFFSEGEVWKMWNASIDNPGPLPLPFTLSQLGGGPHVAYTL